MVKEPPKAVFLAGSTVEVISALACLAELKPSSAAVFVERNISFKTAALDPLLAAARSRFPNVDFIELEIERPPMEGKQGIRSFIRRWEVFNSIEEQINEACEKNFGMNLRTLGRCVREVYFNGLHDYVLVFLAACRKKPRTIFPHGFDQPSRLIFDREPFLHRRRSVLNAIRTVKSQQMRFGPGGLAHGILGLVLPVGGRVCLPFTGVDRVLTFRTGIDPVENEVVRIGSLADTFLWLLDVPPWKDLLQQRNKQPKGESLLLLLSEYNRHPIWTENRNYGVAHLKLLKAVSQSTGRQRFVIKSHVRSDGAAAQWLSSFLKQNQPDWEIEILPLALCGLPVEALSLTGEFAAACSLGSCSLPPGLGFGIPHYVSLSHAALFDEGWEGTPFWVNYVYVNRMLIAEGICCEIEAVTK